MTALQSVVLTLPARLDDRAMTAFEGVFSELLDSAATSFQRGDAGDWHGSICVISGWRRVDGYAFQDHATGQEYTCSAGAFACLEP